MTTTMINKIYDQELKSVKNFLSHKVATLYMVSNELDIMLPQVCLYKQELEKNSKLIILYRGECELTGHTTGYYTSNPKLVNYFKRYCNEKA